MTKVMKPDEQKFYDSLPESGWERFDVRFQDPILDSLIEKGFVDIDRWLTHLWIRRAKSEEELHDDGKIECALCEKRIWFKDSYSPGDEAICAECDTEVTGRQHPPSLNEPAW